MATLYLLYFLPFPFPAAWHQPVRERNLLHCFSDQFFLVLLDVDIRSRIVERPEHILAATTIRARVRIVDICALVSLSKLKAEPGRIENWNLRTNSSGIIPPDRSEPYSGEKSFDVIPFSPKIATRCPTE